MNVEPRFPATESGAVLEQLSWVLRQQLVCIDGLSADALAKAPAVRDANPAAVIVRHTLAVTEAFVLGVVGGEDITRNRPDEFALQSATVDELRAEVEQLVARLANLASSPPDLAGVVLPDARTWGSPVEEPMSRRTVLAETLRHASIHLGELRLTRSLVDEANR